MMGCSSKISILSMLKHSHYQLEPDSRGALDCGELGMALSPEAAGPTATSQQFIFNPRPDNGLHLTAISPRAMNPGEGEPHNMWGQQVTSHNLCTHWNVTHARRNNEELFCPTVTLSDAS